MAFCIYLVREMLFLSGKSQGTLKRDVCGNYGITEIYTRIKNLSTLFRLAQPKRKHFYYK